MTNDRPTATDYIGSVRCGTHLCEFHSTPQGLTETLAPYFAAGLRHDEFCVWITSDPMGVDGAKTELRKVAPYLDRYLDLGQIEIWDYRDWYLRGGRFDADRVLGQWTEKEKRSLDAGYNGIRATGDMAWLEKREWPDFIAYEAEVNRAFPQHRVTGLCTYLLDACPADAVLEIARNHHFTVAQIAGEWEMIETSISRQQQRLSSDVLERQDDERRWIANQLHEVTAQNVSAIAIYLTHLQQSRSWPSDVESMLEKCHTLCEQSMQQILKLSHTLHPPLLDELGLASCLRRYAEDFTKRSRIQVEVEAGPEIERLPLHVETHLFRVAQDGLSNVLHHSESLNAVVRLNRQADQVILQIEDFGRGISASAAAAATGDTAKSRLGLLGMQERLRRIGGHLEIRSSNQGTLLTASIGLS